MRRYGKVDANQAEIVSKLRGIPGIGVSSIAPMGGGIPDLLVGWRRQNWLFEIKQHNGTLTTLESRWIFQWPGQVAVVRSFNDVIEIMGVR